MAGERRRLDYPAYQAASATPSLTLGGAAGGAVFDASRHGQQTASGAVSS